MQGRPHGAPLLAVSPVALPGCACGSDRLVRARYSVWIVAIRSSSCSIVAWALGGPPHSRRSSAWILPCGRPVRWWWAATSVLSWRRRAIRRSPARQRATGSRWAGDRPLPRACRFCAAICSACRLVEQHRHLVGGEQAGQPEVLLLLGRAGPAPACRTRRRRRSPGPARRSRTAPRSACSSSPLGLLGPLRPLQQLVVEPVRVLRRAEDVVALGLHLAGQAEQVRHAGQEDRGRLARRGGPGRTGRSPGRRTAAWRRWWRTRRRPGAGCRRPRTPSGPRPSSARSDAANVGDPLGRAGVVGEHHDGLLAGDLARAASRTPGRSAGRSR